MVICCAIINVIFVSDAGGVNGGWRNLQSENYSLYAIKMFK
jgi:hypothetical protein